MYFLRRKVAVSENRRISCEAVDNFENSKQIELCKIFNDAEKIFEKNAKTMENVSKNIKFSIVSDDENRLSLRKIKVYGDTTLIIFFEDKEVFSCEYKTLDKIFVNTFGPGEWQQLLVNLT